MFGVRSLVVVPPTGGKLEYPQGLNILLVLFFNFQDHNNIYI